MVGKTNAERQAAYRQRQAEQAATEVRGIFAHKDDHAAIKHYAAKLAKKRAVPSAPTFMETRTCTKCGQEKPLSAFAKQKLGKFGRRASCLECGKKANRAAYVAAHPTAKIGPSPHSGMTASERQALYEKRHPEVKTMKYRRARERLSGSYVRGLLADSFGVQRTLISDDVVELKRAQLSVMRQTKQLVQTIKEKQDERN